MEIDKLFVSLALDAAKYSQGLSQAQQEGASWSQRMRATIGGGLQTAAKIGGAAILGVGAIIGGVVASGTNQFIGFQNQMNEVFTLMPGITEDAMSSMSDDVLQFSKDFAVLPDQVVPALYQSLSAGVPPGNVFDFLETAQKAAVGGVTDLETAVDGISSVVNAYGSDVLAAADASDIMFTAVRLGKTDFSQLSSSLFNVIPTASALGVEFGDVAAQLATLTAQGTPTSVATTQIRAAMVEASKTGTKLSDAIENLTDSSFAELIDQGQSMPAIFNDLRASMSDQEFKDLFGSVEAMNAALGITGPNFDTVSAAMDEMNASAGATNAAYDQMNGGIKRTMDRFKAFGSATLIQVGDALSPVLDKVLALGEQALPYVEAALEDVTAFFNGFFAEMEGGNDVLGSIIEAFLTWTNIGENLPVEAVQFIVDLEAGARELWAQLVVLWEAVQPVIAQFVSWQDVLIAVGLILGGVLLSAIAGIVTAIAPVIIAVGAVVAVVALLRNAWENNWGGIQEKTQAVIDFIVPLVQNAIAFIQAFWAENGEAILAKANEIWTGIVNAISTALDFIYNGIIVPTVTAIQAFWAAYGADIMAAAVMAWDAIVQTVQGAIDLVKKIVAAFTAAFQGDWETFGRLIVEIFFDAWRLLIDTAVNSGKVMLTAVSGIVEDVVEKFKQIDWADVGKNIITGIKEGLVGAAGALASAAANAARSALDAAKSALGISSPSKLAAELIGKPFTQGIAEGITAAGHYVDKAVSGVTDRVLASGISADFAASSVSGAAVGRQTITDDHSSKASVMLVNPKFNGVSNIDNFLAEMENLVPA